MATFVSSSYSNGGVPKLSTHKFYDICETAKRVMSLQMVMAKVITIVVWHTIDDSINSEIILFLCTPWILCVNFATVILENIERRGGESYL
jgi:hypothetical protein